jgi:hypothetical protein
MNWMKYTMNALRLSAVLTMLLKACWVLGELGCW